MSMKKNIGGLAAMAGMMAYGAILGGGMMPHYEGSDSPEPWSKPKPMTEPKGDLHPCPKGCKEETVDIEGMPIRIVYQNAKGRAKKVKHYEAEVRRWNANKERSAR